MNSESAKKMVLLTLIIFITLALWGLLWLGDGLPSRIDEVKKPNLDLPRFENITSELKLKSKRVSLLQINPKSDTQVLIIGDSHAKQLGAMARDYSKEYGIGFTLYSFLGCPPIFGTYKTYYPLDGKVEKVNEALCAQQTKDWEQYVKSHKFDYVILSARWNWLVEPTEFSGYKIRRRYLVLTKQKNEITLEASKKNFERQMGKTIRVILRTDAKVILFTQVPHNGRSMGGCANVPHYLMPSSRIKKRCNFVAAPAVRERGAYTLGLFEGISKNKDVMVFDTVPAFCGEKDCSYVDDGVHLKRDDDHINMYGSWYLGRYWKKLPEFPFKDRDSNNK